MLTVTVFACLFMRVKLSHIVLRIITIRKLMIESMMYQDLFHWGSNSK